ncbi:PEGA domain-containing protein [Sorangium sp. So ce1000]|uniref:PEGA domain-containing protein n=1 Tax=Sorangium sp. So ce1000 TaxID=3133325 RepID=UPI003F63E58F
MRKRPQLWSFGVAVALMAQAAGAQQPSTAAAADETDALTETARQLYEEGREAAAAGKWAKAHASFLAAWRIKPHYQIASNLGVACLKLGMHRDAAEYLVRYLREAPATKVNERQNAEASLKEALAKVASVTVQVTPAGAEVTVDGAVVGKAPLPDRVFLDPGKHEIGARLDGYAPATRPIVAVAGRAETVEVQLERAPVAGVGARPFVVEPVAPRDELRTPLLIAGGIAAGAGIVTGVVFGVLSGNRADHAEEVRNELSARWGGQRRCPTGDVAQCKDLKDAVLDEIHFSNVAFGSLVAGGVIGVGTLVYGLVTMETDTGTGTEVKPNPPVPGARVTPILGPGAAGLSFSGRF